MELKVSKAGVFLRYMTAGIDLATVKLPVLARAGAQLQPPFTFAFEDLKKERLRVGFEFKTPDGGENAIWLIFGTRLSTAGDWWLVGKPEEVGKPYVEYHWGGRPEWKVSRERRWWPVYDSLDPEHLPREITKNIREIFDEGVVKKSEALYRELLHILFGAPPPEEEMHTMTGWNEALNPEERREFFWNLKFGDHFIYAYESKPPEEYVMMKRSSSISIEALSLETGKRAIFWNGDPKVGPVEITPEEEMHNIIGWNEGVTRNKNGIDVSKLTRDEAIYYGKLVKGLGPEYSVSTNPDEDSRQVWYCWDGKSGVYSLRLYLYLTFRDLVTGAALAVSIERSDPSTRPGGKPALYTPLHKRKELRKGKYFNLWWEFSPNEFGPYREPGKFAGKFAPLFAAAFEKICSVFSEPYVPPEEEMHDITGWNEAVANKTNTKFHVGDRVYAEKSTSILPRENGEVLNITKDFMDKDWVRIRWEDGNILNYPWDQEGLEVIPPPEEEMHNIIGWNESRRIKPKKFEIVLPVPLEEEIKAKTEEIPVPVTIPANLRLNFECFPIGPDPGGYDRELADLIIRLELRNEEYYSWRLTFDEGGDFWAWAGTTIDKSHSYPHFSDIFAAEQQPHKKLINAAITANMETLEGHFQRFLREIGIGVVTPEEEMHTITGWNEAREKMSPAEKAYKYCVHKLGGRRSPKYEPIIAQDPKYAARYAEFILRKRWPEAEPAIADHPPAGVYYCEWLIKKRWPKLEKRLLDPNKPWIGSYAVDYAEKVIKGPWPELEQFPPFLQDAYSCFRYATDVLHHRFRPGEEMIIGSSFLSAKYVEALFHLSREKAEEALRSPEFAAKGFDMFEVPPEEEMHNITGWNEARNYDAYEPPPGDMTVEEFNRLQPGDEFQFLVFDPQHEWVVDKVDPVYHIVQASRKRDKVETTFYWTDAEHMKKVRFTPEEEMHTITGWNENVETADEALIARFEKADDSAPLPLWANTDKYVPVASEEDKELLYGVEEAVGLFVAVGRLMEGVKNSRREN